MKGRIAYCAALLVLGLGAPAAAQPAETLFEVSVGKYLMGTRVEATVRAPDIQASKAALVRAFQEMERVEHLVSFQDANSEVSKVNAAAGRRPVRVSAETFALIRRAVGYSERLDGLFDPSIGPLSALWGFSSDHPATTLPDTGRVAALLRLVDYRQIVLNEADTTVYLATPGMEIDLGGIAKGYAIDRGVQVLRDQGIRQFLINAGGDVYASGKKDGDTAWRVGVKHPREADGMLARFDLSDYAVATSGDYERYTTIDGRRYHHILDPRTGYPAPLCQSVTVLAPTAEEADVLATYLFVLGPEHADRSPLHDRAYLIVDAGGGVHYSSAMQDARLEMAQ